MVVKFNVKTLDGANHLFEESGETTLGEFRPKLAEVVNIQPDEQRLIFLGHVLETDKNAQSLSQLEIDGKTLHIVSRPPPPVGINRSGASNNTHPRREHERPNANEMRAIVDRVISSFGERANNIDVNFRERDHLIDLNLTIRQSSTQIIDTPARERLISLNFQLSNLHHMMWHLENEVMPLLSSPERSTTPIHRNDVRMQETFASIDEDYPAIIGNCNNPTHFVDPATGLRPNVFADENHGEEDCNILESYGDAQERMRQSRTSYSRFLNRETAPGEGANPNLRYRQANQPTLSTVAQLLQQAHNRLSPILDFYAQRMRNAVQYSNTPEGREEGRQEVRFFQAVQLLLHNLSHLTHLISELNIHFAEPLTPQRRLYPQYIEAPHEVQPRATVEMTLSRDGMQPPPARMPHRVSPFQRMPIVHRIPSPPGHHHRIGRLPFGQQRQHMPVMAQMVNHHVRPMMIVQRQSAPLFRPLLYQPHVQRLATPHQHLHPTVGGNAEVQITMGQDGNSFEVRLNGQTVPVQLRPGQSLNQSIAAALSQALRHSFADLSQAENLQLPQNFDTILAQAFTGQIDQVAPPGGAPPQNVQANAENVGELPEAVQDHPDSTVSNASSYLNPTPPSIGDDRFAEQQSGQRAEDVEHQMHQSTAPAQQDIAMHTLINNNQELITMVQHENTETHYIAEQLDDEQHMREQIDRATFVGPQVPAELPLYTFDPYLTCSSRHYNPCRMRQRFRTFRDQARAEAEARQNQSDSNQQAHDESREVNNSNPSANESLAVNNSTMASNGDYDLEASLRRTIGEVLRTVEERAELTGQRRLFDAEHEQGDMPIVRANSQLPRMYAFIPVGGGPIANTARHHRLMQQQRQQPVMLGLTAVEMQITLNPREHHQHNNNAQAMQVGVPIVMQQRAVAQPNDRVTQQAQMLNANLTQQERQTIRNMMQTTTQALSRNGSGISMNDLASALTGNAPSTTNVSQMPALTIFTAHVARINFPAQDLITAHFNSPVTMINNNRQRILDYARDNLLVVNNSDGNPALENLNAQQRAEHIQSIVRDIVDTRDYWQQILVENGIETTINIGDYSNVHLPLTMQRMERRHVQTILELFADELCRTTPTVIFGQQLMHAFAQLLADTIYMIDLMFDRTPNIDDAERQRLRDEFLATLIDQASTDSENAQSQELNNVIRRFQPLMVAMMRQAPANYLQANELPTNDRLSIYYISNDEIRPPPAVDDITQQSTSDETFELANWRQILPTEWHNAIDADTRQHGRKNPIAYTYATKPPKRRKSESLSVERLLQSTLQASAARANVEPITGERQIDVTSAPPSDALTSAFAQDLKRRIERRLDDENK